MQITITSDAVRAAVEAALFDYERAWIGETGLYNDLGAANRSVALQDEDQEDAADAVWETLGRLEGLRTQVETVRTVPVGETVALAVDAAKFRRSLEWSRDWVEEKNGGVGPIWDACAELERLLEPEEVA